LKGLKAGIAENISIEIAVPILKVGTRAGVIFNVIVGIYCKI
jgi:hypothetical protein